MDMDVAGIGKHPSGQAEHHFISVRCEDGLLCAEFLHWYVVDNVRVIFGFLMNDLVLAASIPGSDIKG